MQKNLPENAINSVNDIFKADYIITIVTTAFQKCTAQEYLNQLSKSFPEQKILLSGIQFTSNPSLKTSKNVSIVADLNSFISLVDSVAPNQQ